MCCSTTKRQHRIYLQEKPHASCAHIDQDRILHIQPTRMARLHKYCSTTKHQLQIFLQVRRKLHVSCVPKEQDRIQHHSTMMASTRKCYNTTKRRLQICLLVWSQDWARQEHPH